MKISSVGKISIVILFCFVTIFGVYRFYNSVKLKNEQRIIEFLATKKIVFPPSFILLNYKYINGFLDDSLFLKFQIKKEDLETFIKSSPFANEKLSNNQIPNSLRFHNYTWWQINDAKKYLAKEIWLPNAEILATLIDLDNPELITIYLCWGQT